MSNYTIGWLAWLSWFGIEEGLALAKGGKGATLSAHVWKWFAIKQDASKSQVVRVRKFALLAFLAWLCTHFLTGGKF